MKQNPRPARPTNPDSAFVAGMDVGGTKVHIADTRGHAVHRYDTSDFPDLYAILDDYFATLPAKPVRMVVAMAGPRDDDTGIVRLTNVGWPPFDPREATKRYKLPFSTVNDMVATTAGMLQETGVDLKRLKSGTSMATGTKVAVAISTGIGVAAAAWDVQTERRCILATEGSHIGFQPKNHAEAKYLAFLRKKYPHPSAELALSGKHDIEHMVDHMLEGKSQTKLSKAVSAARSAGRPVGAVILEFATEGSGEDKTIAQAILEQLGAMLGSVLRDFAVAYKATGGIYLTGSVAMALGEYFADETSFIERFVCKGAVHHDWVADIPIYLLLDPNIAVVGALALAKQ